ncbi:unnamed protein product [Paramecium pentaurelia]|uniref:Uncharacterized protein n=1 Tax=Paramecium pentaurelia TaxID=43138 RepID=A0A8S1X4P5_9CILI|nr:unnamed protein product [Paramecium pentaurelia]
MQKKKFHHNNNMINNYHYSNEEEDLKDSLYGISEVIPLQCYESPNIEQEQELQDIILQDYPIMINKDIERKIYKVDHPLKINDFTQQNLHKNFNLYNQPKKDNAFKKPSFIRSRIYKQYISHRTKMNTEKIE